MGEADVLVFQAELSRRWGVSSRTVNRRLVFLGITPQRRGRHHDLTPEQVEMAERFHQHLSQGRGSDSFKGLEHPIQLSRQGAGSWSLAVAQGAAPG